MRDRPTSGGLNGAAATGRRGPDTRIDRRRGRGSRGPAAARQSHLARVQPENAQWICSPAGTVQVHLRPRPSEAELLRRVARDRDQTISAVVRSLLKPLRAGVTSSGPLPAGPPGASADRDAVTGDRH